MSRRLELDPQGRGALTARALGLLGPAALVLFAPTALLAGCGVATEPQVEFDAPDARTIVSVEPCSGDVALSLHAAQAPLSSRWLIDPDTGARSEDLNRVSPFDAAWLVAPIRAIAVDRVLGPVLVARLALRDGERELTVQMGRHTWPGFSSPRATLVYVRDAATLEVVSLIDGATRSFSGIPRLADVISLQVSPDGRWIALGDWVRYDPEDRGRGYHRARLVDADTGEVVRSVDCVGFIGWLAGPEPLAVADAPNGRFRREGPRYLAIGPSAERPLHIAEDALTVAGLADGRLVCTTYDQRVVVARADGAIERTLRAPRQAD